MENLKRKLQLEQLNKKIKAFDKLEPASPACGWVYATRTALGMSMEQLGKKMGITKQGIKDLERREAGG